MKRSGLTTAGLWAIICGSAMGQTPKQWPCMDEVGGHAIRISAGVSERLARRMVLPEISDIKNTRLDSVVVVVIVDAEGNVVWAEAEQGTADLFPKRGGRREMAIQAVAVERRSPRRRAGES